ncbi:winged helix-turn-helix domain-containing protein [Methanothermococcus sp.]|uniref:winged helix-turn-helix domain-containing protein n=1 Tax=Methanothermococcus sp. TaxID=2614238 RepID=UPI0025CECC91|nr:winged helix-turn-helix domain-containing protein [Methanothermococcus sp.]
MKDMWLKIGEAAGKIYHLLEEDEKNITKLKESLKSEGYNETIVIMAIGWLAREDKVNIIKDGRKWIIRLK